MGMWALGEMVLKAFTDRIVHRSKSSPVRIGSGMDQIQNIVSGDRSRIIPDMTGPIIKVPDRTGSRPVGSVFLVFTIFVQQKNCCTFLEGSRAVRESDDLENYSNNF